MVLRHRSANTEKRRPFGHGSRFRSESAAGTDNVAAVAREIILRRQSGRVLAETVRRRIALLVTAFAVPGILAFFGNVGPAPGAPRAIAVAVVLSTLPAAAVVWKTKDSFRWWRRDHTHHRAAVAFTVYADVGTGTYLLLFQQPLFALIGCALFAVISTFVAFFGGRAAVIVHLTLTTGVIVWITSLVLRETDFDVPAVLAAATSIWMAVNATMSVVSSTSTGLHRSLEIQVEHAQTDPLTGLLNMRGLEVYAAARFRGATRLGFLLIDLDHFKRINDRHGHVAGDAVLALTAKRLRAFVGDDGIPARRGGEEFLVVVDACDVDPHTLARSVRTMVNDPTDGIPVTVSIGVSVIESSFEGETDIGRARRSATGDAVNHGMHLADIAMYRAKAAGRDTVVVYDGPDHGDILTDS